MVVFDVGSFNGDDGLHWHNQGYNVIAFEPKKDLYEAIVNKTRHLANQTPYFRVVNKAVSLVNEPVTFYLSASGGASSILPFRPDQDLEKHWPHRMDILYSGTSYTVDSTRLDTFLEQNGLTNEIIEHIHIDAQGIDLDVMKSLGKYISNVKTGVLETCYSLDKAIYSAQKDDLPAVKEWLVANGFTVNNVEQNDSSHCECNVHFQKP